MIKKILLYTLLAVVLLIGTLAVNLWIFTRASRVVSKGNPIPAYEHGQSALLVVDIQECTTGTVSSSEDLKSQSEWLVPMINRLIRKADSLEIPVVFIRSEVTNPLLNVLNNSMAPGSEGAKLDHRLSVSESDPVITKSRNDAFSNPELDRVLGEMEVDHIYLTGLDAAHCVDGTFLGALNRGYRITVIADAVISAPPDIRDGKIEEFKSQGAQIIQSKEFP
jgi:nicotinamidase/pyrazinamidase